MALGMYHTGVHVLELAAMVLMTVLSLLLGYARERRARWVLRCTAQHVDIRRLLPTAFLNLNGGSSCAVHSARTVARSSAHVSDITAGTQVCARML